MDRILLEGVTLPTHVGVPDEERRAPQDVVLDVELEFDLRSAARADDFTLTIDYAAVRETLARVASARPRRLIETLAEELAAAILGEYPVARIRLRLMKPQALRAVGVSAPGVEIVRGRGNG